MVRLKPTPKSVCVHMRPSEGEVLLEVSSQIPMVAPNAVARVAFLHGLEAMRGNPDLMAKLLKDELDRRQSTGRTQAA